MDMEAAVRKLGGVWPLIKELNPVDDKPGALFISGSRLFVSKGLHNGYSLISTHTEFDECARRLRNEPDWKDAPPWAVAKAQDDDGEWYWYEVKPKIKHNCFVSTARSEFASRGEVIDSWGQTLRLRPEEKKMEAIIIGPCKCGGYGQVYDEKTEAELGRCHDDLKTVLARQENKTDWQHRGEFPDKEVGRLSLKEGNEVFEAAVVREQLDREGVPRTSSPLPFFPEGNPYSLWGRVKRYAEMAVEAEKKKMVEDSAPDNNWHQRGEFPPVGTVCRLRFITTADIVATITYVGDGILCYRDDKGMEYAAVSESVKLLPLETERERWIEKAKRHFTHDCDTEASLLSMYNDGLAKMPEENQ